MKRPAIFVFVLIVCLLIGVVFAQTSQQPKLVFKDQIELLIKANSLDNALALIDSIQPDIQSRKEWYAYAYYEGRYAKVLKMKSKYQEAIARIDAALKLLSANNWGDSESAGELWVWRALQLRMLQRWPEALESYQKAIQCFEKQNSYNEDLPYAYKNAAQIYQRFSDNRLALKYLEHALKSDTTSNLSVSIFTQLANGYLLMDSLVKAEYYFNQINFNKKNEYLGFAYATGADLESKKNNIPLAEVYAKIALDSLKNDPKSGDNVMRIYALLASLSARKGNLTQAASYYDKSESVGKKNYLGAKSREMARLFLEKAQFLYQNNRTEQAISYCQQALIQAFPNFNETDWHKNPPIKEVYPEWQISQAALTKASYLLDDYFEIQSQANKVKEYDFSLNDRLSNYIKASSSKAKILIGSHPLSLEDRLIAADCFDLGLESASLLRKQSAELLDKQDLSQNIRNWTIQAIENLVEIQKIAPSPNVYTRLLTCIERSKSQALRDAVHQKSLFDYVSLPDSIRTQEKLLRGSISYLKNQLVDNALAGGKLDSNKLNLINTELFRTEFAYRELIDQLKTEHPAFGAQLAADPILNVDSLRTSLPDSAAILSFFDTGNRYLLLTTTRKGIKLNEIPCDTAFKNLLSGFIQRLSDRSAQENDPERYYQDAWLLYQKLLPANALAGVKSLTIIPDGALCYLPFEALLTQAYKGSYARAPYLMRAYNVAYNWSAAIPFQAVNNGHGMLQVAPFTSSARDGLTVLPNSRLEADNHIHLQSLTDAAASFAAFCEKSSDYAVLHIATHAQAGGQNLPRVEFFDRSLSAQEIYGLRFNASLVTLSACETGAGKYAGGEGVLSLARAFAAVGARSLVASHWTVNEFSTAQLFKSFYTYLFAGQTKSESLRAAKLAYLDSETPDARKAPFYWAAFTLTGADGKVDLGGEFPWIYLWVVLAIGGAVLFIRRLFV